MKEIKEIEFDSEVTETPHPSIADENDVFITLEENAENEFSDADALNVIGREATNFFATANVNRRRGPSTGQAIAGLFQIIHSFRTSVSE